jgi:pyrroloquinoline quinone biosynthesis protein D
MTIDGSQRPRLVRRARLQLDAISGANVLLSPERGLVLNESAAAIVGLCRGGQTIDQMADQLATRADRARVRADIVELLSELHRRRLIELETNP